MRSSRRPAAPAISLEQARALVASKIDAAGRKAKKRIDRGRVVSVRLVHPAKTSVLIYGDDSIIWRVLERPTGGQYEYPHPCPHAGESYTRDVSLKGGFGFRTPTDACALCGDLLKPEYVYEGDT